MDNLDFRYGQHGLGCRGVQKQHQGILSLRHGVTCLSLKVHVPQSLMICVQVRGSKRLGCHTSHQKADRCCTSDESEESIACRWQSIQARDPPWLRNPGQTLPESKAVVSVSREKDLCQTTNKNAYQHCVALHL